MYVRVRIYLTHVLRHLANLETNQDDGNVVSFLIELNGTKVKLLKVN